MENEIWRFYNDLEGTSIMCESQEECEHLVAKFAEAAKKGFFKDCEDFFPFYEDVQFKEDDSITPMGYECTLYANVKLDLTHWGSHIITHRIAHYFYYRDRDEEAERAKIKKYCDTDVVKVAKKPYIPPTLTAIVRGEVCKFVAETSSPTDWTPKKDPLYNDLQVNKEEVKELIEELGILLDCLPSSDKALKIMEDRKQTTLFNLKPSSFKFVICKVLDLITPF